MNNNEQRFSWHAHPQAERKHSLKWCVKLSQATCRTKILEHPPLIADLNKYGICTACYYEILSEWNVMRVVRQNNFLITPADKYPADNRQHTYSMVQSPSWFAASQEIPRISRNPKVHYRTHKRTPPVSILDQPNPVHIPTSHLLEIHPNIIHPSTPRSPQWSSTLRFPHQDPTHSPLLTHTRHMASPSQSST